MAYRPEDPLESPFTSKPIEAMLQEKGFSMVFIPDDTDSFNKQMVLRMRVQGQYEVVHTGIASEYADIVTGKNRIGMFVYDPSRGEIIDETVEDPVLARKRSSELKRQGWNSVPSAPNRVVFYRPIRP